MSDHIVIVDQGPLSGPLTPDLLEQAHAAWAGDVAAFGPFTPVEQRLAGQTAQRVWTAPSPGGPVFVLGRTTTTMEAAWTLVQGGNLDVWGAVLAVEQTEGRGQLRRPWQSPPGNLHLSLRWPRLDESDPEQRAWSRPLPLVLGHCLAVGLERLGGGPIMLKWPNDLVSDGRKVGGLLIEQRGTDVVAGLGLNIHHAPEAGDMRRDAAMEADVLSLPGNHSKPLTLCLSLVNLVKNEYLKLLESITPQGFLRLVAERILWMGRTVYLAENREISRVRLVDLAQDGGLIVDRSGREETIYSGSISLEQRDSNPHTRPVIDGAD